MEKLIFPQLSEAKWHKNINLNKYAQLIREDILTHPARTWGTHNPFLNPHLFGDWINLLHKTLGVDYSWGGWLEDREDILEGTYLPKGGKVHLGVDFWVPEGTDVHLPKAGQLVFSQYDHDLDGGWGGKAIFKIEDNLYLIFGHLMNLVKGVNWTYQQDSVVGQVAPVGEFSGGWHPHLHLQCMRKFDVNVDGYGRQDSWNSKVFPNPLLHI